MWKRRSGGNGAETLGRFAECARAAQTTSELIGAVMDLTALAVNASVSGCYLQTATSFEISQAGAPDALALRYAAFTAVWNDPIHEALTKRHVATRSSELFDQAAWMAQPLYHEVEAPFGLDAYMAAELFDGRRARGVIGVVRKAGSPGFSPTEAQQLQTLCLHASVALTRLGFERGHIAISLTATEQELVRLVANGLTNEQIAHVRGVTSYAVKKGLERLYHKAGVASRAELVAYIQIP